MKQNQNLVLVHSEAGDWVALYRDGKKVDEGHSLRPGDVLRALGLDYGTHTLSTEWLEENGSYFPDTLNEFPST
jgi:hypothetical protein